MKTTATLLVATAALVSAQTFDPTTGKYKCPKPNVAYCAGDSLKTDIIIRCDASGIGQPGRCTDNLAGEPPQGLNTALCYQKDADSGTAACEKNCVVYGGSGNSNGTFTLPAALCKPSYTASATSTTTSVPIGTGSSSYPSTTLITYTSGTVTSVCTSSSLSPPPPLSTGGGNGGGSGGGNGNGGGNGGGSGSGNGNGTVTYPATKTPPTPTKSTSPTSVPTAGAAANRVGGVLAAVGLIAAYFL